MDTRHPTPIHTAEVIPFPVSAISTNAAARNPAEDCESKVIQFSRKLSADDTLVETLERLALEQLELERWWSEVKDSPSSDDEVNCVTRHMIIGFGLRKATNESGLALDQLTSLARGARSARARELALWSVSYRWHQACYRDPTVEREEQAMVEDWQDLRSKLMELGERFGL